MPVVSAMSRPSADNLPGRNSQRSTSARSGISSDDSSNQPHASLAPGTLNHSSLARTLQFIVVTDPAKSSQNALGPAAQLKEPPATHEANRTDRDSFSRCVCYPERSRSWAFGTPEENENGVCWPCLRKPRPMQDLAHLTQFSMRSIFGRVKDLGQVWPTIEPKRCRMARIQFAVTSDTDYRGACCFR